MDRNSQQEGSGTERASHTQSLENEKIVTIKNNLEAYILTQGVSSFTESLYRESDLTKAVTIFLGQGKVEEATALWKQDFTKRAPEGDDMGVYDWEEAYKKILLAFLKEGKSQEVKALQAFKKKVWFDTFEPRERDYELLGISSNDNEISFEENEKVILMSALDRDFLKNNMMKALQMTGEAWVSIAALPERTDYQLRKKFNDYKTLAEKRITGRLEVSTILDELEKLAVIPEKDTRIHPGYGIFRKYLDLCVLSIVSDEKQEERMQKLIAMGLELQHGSDETGSMFEGMVEVSEKMEGKKWDPRKFVSGGLEFVLEVSSPLARTLIPAYTEKGEIEKARMLTESGLLDPISSAEAYVTILLGVDKNATVEFNGLFSRFQELVAPFSLLDRSDIFSKPEEVKYMELYRDLIVGLAGKGDYEKALSIFDYTAMVEAKTDNGNFQLDRQDIYIDLLYEMRKGKRDISDLREKVKEPLTIFQYAELGMFEQAQGLLTNGDYEIQPYGDVMFLIQEMRRSGVDASKVIEKVNSLLAGPDVEDPRHYTSPFYDGERGRIGRSVDLLEVLQ
jgi:hypothetical protein